MMKGGVAAASVIVMIATFAAVVIAGDEDPLQDFCVADLTSPAKVNGFTCKAAEQVSVSDFLLKGLNVAGNTENALGSNVTGANVQRLAGLNTLGISLARIDYAFPSGLNPPHTHPRASEVLFLSKGSLYVGFVDTANKLFATTIHEGDVFVFPRGLVHFQINVGNVDAVAIAALSSQLPGTQQVARSLFGSDPPIKADVLAKAFQIPSKLVNHIQAKF